MKKIVHGKTGLSQRKIGKTFKVSQQGVSSVFKRLGLHYLKRSVVPKVTKAQVMKQKSGLSKLRRGIFKLSSPVVIVMDDECYFSLSGESMATNRGYYTDGSNPVARNVQCRGKRKFPHEFFYDALSVLVASANHSCVKVELLPMFFTKT